MKKKFLCLIAGLLVMASVNSKAESRDMIEIIEKAQKAFAAVTSISAKATFTLKSDGKERGKMIAGFAKKQLSGGSNALILVFLEPSNVRGNAYLCHESNGGSFEQWVYFPPTKRIRKIGGISSYESLFQTDFSYSDLSFIDKKRNNFKLIDEETLNGEKTYKIEVLSKERTYYSRTILWVSTKTFLPLRMDFYDLNDILWKRKTYGQVTTINGIMMASKTQISDFINDTETELNIKDASSTILLEDNVFVPEQLRYALKCPVWEKVCYPNEQ